MSVQSERDVSFSSPNKLGHSVHFRMQDVGCQADDHEKLPHLHRGSVDPEQITLTPFSNLRNGSQLKMSWHRWTGGTTRGAQKTSNADPAVSLTLNLLDFTFFFLSPFPLLVDTHGYLYNRFRFATFHHHF
jgi:hypothetical protein